MTMGLKALAKETLSKVKTDINKASGGSLTWNPNNPHDIFGIDSDVQSQTNPPPTNAHDAVKTLPHTEVHRFCLENSSDQTIEIKCKDGQVFYGSVLSCPDAETTQLLNQFLATLKAKSHLDHAPSAINGSGPGLEKAMVAYVTDHEGVPIAACTLRPVPSTDLFELFVVVDPQYQNDGIAGQLCTQTVDIGHQQGIKHISIPHNLSDAVVNHMIEGLRQKAHDLHIQLSTEYVPYAPIRAAILSFT